ncbi:hypothetical protein AVEN_6741-1 [Araneus ventricosus]|uniref:Uncharacterized protein n=1 Tax=Araneus ventricosus TaxID=182803 RepID=A0A4Y2RCJ4_ARAVE|nr:hypothetical protein AVEN_6741-1 [Araneus ventricosus]
MEGFTNTACSNFSLLEYASSVDKTETVEKGILHTRLQILSKSRLLWKIIRLAETIRAAGAIGSNSGSSTVWPEEDCSE